MSESVAVPLQVRIKSLLQNDQIDEARALIEIGLAEDASRAWLLRDLARLLIAEESFDAAADALSQAAALEPPGSETEILLAGIALSLDRTIDLTFWSRRAKLCACLRPDLPWTNLVVTELAEAALSGDCDERHAVAYRRAAAHLIAAWCAAYRQPLPDTGLRGAVTAKAHAAANRSNPLVLRASSLISDILGRRLVAGWFGGSSGTRMRDHEAVVRIGGRDLMFGIPNLNIRFDCRYFFAFEPGLLFRISTFEPEERFLDIGANIGRYTVLAAGLCGVRVDAIEPFVRNAEELIRNVSRNGLEGLVTLHQVAVSDQTGSGCVAYGDEPAGSTDQSIADRPGIDPRPGAEFHEAIEVWRIDEMVAAGRIPFPNRIKIDVDGVEHKVLDGMTGILSDPRLKSIRIEIRLEDPLNQAALKRTLEYGFVARVGDDPKNLDLTRPDGRSDQ